MFEIRRQEHEVESEVHLERTVGSLLFQRSKVTTLLTLVFFFFLNAVVCYLQPNSMHFIFQFIVT